MNTFFDKNPYFSSFLFFLGLMIFGSWSSSLDAAAPGAKVLVVRGKVTKLLPGQKEASKVRRSEFLPEQTSVVTGERSMVQIRFPNGSKVVLGPKSKLVVSQMEKKKGNIVGLLTGKISAQVKKDILLRKEKQDKLVVKTRSAAMGVRGTSFVGVFNPKNNVTSLVTLDGEVAMAKITPKMEKKLLKSPAEMETLIKNNLKAPTSRVVRAGRISSSLSGVDKATIPVKISPKQYKALKKSANIKIDTTSELKPQVDDPPAEGLKDALGQNFAPQAGGFVDLVTGLYIPPGKTAVLDSKQNLFVASNEAGSVDANTGGFIPPKGLELDPLEGFVAKKDAGSDEVAKALALNKVVILKKDMAQLMSGTSDPILPEKEDKDNTPASMAISLTYGVGKEELVATIENYPGQRTVSSDAGFGFALTLERELWGKLWGKVIFGQKSSPYTTAENTLETEGSSSKTLVFGFGLSYKTGGAFQFTLGHSRQKMAFLRANPSTNSVSDLTLIRIGLGETSLGADFNFYARKAFQGILGLELINRGTVARDGLYHESGGGMRLGLGLRHAYEERAFVEGRLYVENSEHPGHSEVLERQKIGLQVQLRAGF